MSIEDRMSDFKVRPSSASEAEFRSIRPSASPKHLRVAGGAPELAFVEKAFDPHERRDTHGRWTDGAGAPAAAESFKRFIDPTSEPEVAQLALHAFASMHAAGIDVEKFVGRKRIRFTSNTNPRALGTYRHASGIAGREKPEVAVQPDGLHPEITMLHELGHHFDWATARPRGRFSSDDTRSRTQSPFMATLFILAAHNTPSIQAIDKVESSVEAPRAARTSRYLLSPVEMWARAFAQHVATHAQPDSPEGEWLKKHVYASKGYDGMWPKQWSASDFAHLDEVVGSILSKAGVAVPTDEESAAFWDQVAAGNVAPAKAAPPVGVPSDEDLARVMVENDGCSIGTAAEIWYVERGWDPDLDEPIRTDPRRKGAPELAFVEKDFNPRQRRDRQGRWTDTGAGTRTPSVSLGKDAASVYASLGFKGDLKPDPKSTWSAADDLEAAETIKQAIERYPILKDGPVPITRIIRATQLHRRVQRGSLPGDRALDKSMEEFMIAASTMYPGARSQQVVLNDRWPTYMPASKHRDKLPADEVIVSVATASSVAGVMWHEMGHALANENEAVDSDPKGFLASHGIQFGRMGEISRYAHADANEAIGELSAMWNVMPDRLPAALRPKVEAMFKDLADGAPNFRPQRTPLERYQYLLDHPPNAVKLIDPEADRAAAVNLAAGDWVTGLPGRRGKACGISRKGMPELTFVDRERRPSKPHAWAPELTFVEKRFDPRERRDDHGRWTAGGGGGAGIPKVLAQVQEAGLDDWPTKGAVAQKLLGDAADTQALWRTRKTDAGVTVYSRERKPLHDKIVGRALAPGLAHVLGESHPLTRKVARGGTLTDGEKQQVRVAAKRKVGTPRALFMAGGPASGKTSALKAAPELEPDGAVLVNPDDIKEQLPEYQQMVAGNEKFAASGAHEESSDLAKRIEAEAKGLGLNIVIDGTGDSKQGKFVKRIRSVHAAGYDVSALYVTVPTDVALERAIARARKTGRWVPASEIRSQHKNVSGNFPDVAALPLRDVKVFDSNGGEGDAPRLIAQGAAGKVNALDQPLFDAFVAKAKE